MKKLQIIAAIHNEHSLKDAIDNKRVRWQEYRVPAPLTNSTNPAIEPAL